LKAGEVTIINHITLNTEFITHLRLG